MDGYRKPVKKFDLVTDLYAETLKEVSGSSENWIFFLRSACRNYRLPFDEQLLIYKQRPDATAVLDMEGWNKKFGRWVKHDSKGIAVFDKSAGTMRLKYYFDVSDTKEGKYPRLVRPVSLWEIQEDYRDNIRESLANAFGVSEGKKNFEETILETAENIAEDNLTDYLQDILENCKESFLEGMDAYHAEVELKKLLSASIAYMVMTRCGIDAGIYFDTEDFHTVRDLNTPELMNLFGSANSDMAGMALSEIADTIRKIQSRDRQERRTFAQDGAGVYNQDKNAQKQVKERGNFYDDNRNQVSQTGRLPVSGSDRTGRNGSARWEVWLTPPQISGGNTLRDLSKSDDTGKTPAAFGRDTERSKGDGGTSDDRDEAVAECDGETESRRSDDMASDGKQYPAGGRGNSNERTDIQLEEEQHIGGDEAGEETPAFSDVWDSDTTWEEVKEVNPEPVSLAGRLRELYEESDYFGYEENMASGKSEKEVLDEIGKKLTEPEGAREILEFITDMQKGTEPGVSAYQELEDMIHEVESLPVTTSDPQPSGHQYRITDDELGYGTAKEKFRANIAAIQMLKKCESEKRYATPEEQEWLAKYVGWGGLSDAFDETKSAWSTEYLELRTILTADEYEAARQSTLTAFYTPPVVIRVMYQALENMGFKSGNILEPSCAVGNFIGMKPESLSECKVYGVEIDSISGRIASQLYQKSVIAVQGFEETELPDSFFDVAVGNVPFGQFKVADRRYDRHNFLVHDYFFAKALDKVRPGGVIAFITSSGTMDKKNPSIRKYIAQRAELLGAVRLPNDTFKKNAGTEVTADIIFLQKRDRLLDVEPDWVYLDTDKNGIEQNSYFVSHPEMILGEMVLESSRFGRDSVCRPYEDKDLETLLQEAVSHIHGEISEYETDILGEENVCILPADPSVANFSYTVVDSQIYFRENSYMKPIETSVTGANRIKGMIAIRDCVRELIAYQTEGCSDEEIRRQQEKLNRLYDTFSRQYGLLNGRANNTAFSDDGSYPLLCSLEILAEDGTLKRKADMFTKRTIKPHEAVTSVNTASEAYALSMAEKARVDMDYMCALTGKDAEEIEKELEGVIFRVPDVTDNGSIRYVAEDEYLSGNVREKLEQAKIALQSSEIYKKNVEALEKVQPKELSASEISVRLGTTWIPTEDIADFMFHLLDTPNYSRWYIKVHFSELTGEWNIEGKSVDKGNLKANNTYGTRRANAYRIIEDSLNLRDTRIYDYIEGEEGKKKAVLNKTETAIAQGKQEIIRQAFKEWIWTEPERRQRLTKFYNENFNAVRPREYDGSHLKFYGMNPEIRLRKHQVNGAARIIYGGNTLLAYVVGAGKTYTMVAAAMESKRLGLCSKSMIVVPNHIIEQFASEWLQLYPAANLLVTTKKDFETENRKKFCARIATSDLDAVIIGHSQFEKIPLSVERQQQMLERQIDDVLNGIMEAKARQGDRFTVKQLEKSKKALQAKLKKLNDQSRKDDVVSFEQLGIDRLFVDEADGYKNLYLYTKMRNVGGIAQTEAQKSSDMFMKCRYLDDVICCEL